MSPHRQTVKAIAALVVIVLGVGVLAYYFRGGGSNRPPDDAYYRTYICSETGQAFRHRIQEGDVTPILSPYSRKNTGYPAEMCYWNADGSTRKDPTPVLLKESGPTFCPDCGRLVVGHNPRPAPGRQLPPTAEEYAARRGH